MNSTIKLCDDCKLQCKFACHVLLYARFHSERNIYFAQYFVCVFNTRGISESWNSVRNASKSVRKRDKPILTHNNNES